MTLRHVIPSRAQAEAIADAHRAIGADASVFSYEQKVTRLTLFGIDVTFHGPGGKREVETILFD